MGFIFGIVLIFAIFIGIPFLLYVFAVRRAAEKEVGAEGGTEDNEKSGTKDEKKRSVPWKLLLLGGVALLVLFFAEDIFSFDWTATSLGRWLESTFGAGTAVFVWLAIGVAGFLLLRSKSSDQKKVKTFASSGVGGFIETLVGSAGMAIIFGVVGLGVIIGIFVIAGIADSVTGGKVQQQIDTGVAIMRGESLPNRTVDGVQCDFKRKLDARRNTISTAWIAVTICKDDGQFLVFVPSGTQPEIDFRDRDDRVLTSHPITDYVRIEHTYGQPGGMPNLYRVFIPANSQGFANGFNKAFRDAVTFEIRAR